MISKAPRVVAIVATATLVIIAAAGGWLVYNRLWPHPSTESVETEGETIGNRSLGVQIQVPAGAPENTTVRFSAGSSPAGTDPLYAAPAGDPVSVVPSAKSPDGTKVMLNFDLEKAAQRAGLAGAVDAGNAFIAVFDETWWTWMPLPTTYDADRHTLTATPPHFSDVRAWFTKPGRWIRDGSEIVGGKTRDAARWTFDTTVSIGESGVNAAKEMAEAA